MFLLISAERFITFDNAKLGSTFFFHIEYLAAIDVGHEVELEVVKCNSQEIDMKFTYP